MRPNEETAKAIPEQLTLDESQHRVNAWIRTIGVRYFNELTNLGILTEEVGELSRIMVRRYGEQSCKDTDEISDEKLADEMADVLWVLLCLANQTGVRLNDALLRNFEKKTARDGQRHRNNDKLSETSD